MKPAIILIGGSSRAARALRHVLEDRIILSIVRQQPGSAAQPGELAVADYARPPAGIAFSGATIINCVGTATGGPQVLDAVNRAVPLAWARAAKAGGARHFIQLSSFSVFGAAGLVTHETPLAPVTPYGRSKRDAERALMPLADDHFDITLLRIPALVGQGDDKLAQLVRLACALRMVPAAPWPCPRAMLSFDGLAAVIRRLIDEPPNADEPCGAAMCIADPAPFTPQMLVEQARLAGRTLHPLVVPRLLLAMLRRLAPGIHASLFMPMALADEANHAAAALPFERLEQVVARELARTARTAFPVARGGGVG